MKKLFVSALAIASLVACSKDELVDQPTPAAISFEQAFVENATRVAEAADPSTTTASIDAFDVWGFMDKTSGIVFENQDVTKSGTDWVYNPLQYWMPDHTYYFGALAPMNSANWALDATNANENGVGVVSFTNVDGSEDLLYAAATASTAGMVIGKDIMDPVKLTFNHLLSKVKFSFTNGFTSDNTHIVVKNVQMVAPKSASIDLAQADWWSTNKWTGYEGETTLAFGDVNEFGGDMLEMGEKQEAAAERLTIPTDAHEYAISFDVELYLGDVLALKSTKETTVTVALEIGKAYNFCTVLDASNIADSALQPIEFEVIEVKDWVDAGVVDVYNVTASTEAELMAALDGTDKNIAITSDLTLTEPIKVTGGDVIINLGGHKINTNVDGFEVAGGTLTINGEGEITAAAKDGTPYCAVWAYGDAVVNIYGGTYKIGYPTGDYNDLIYAKDNAVINIYAGTFYNSGKDNSFVLNLKDGSAADINVYGGSYENFDPANNNSEGPGTNFVVDGYKSVEASGWYTVYPM